MPKVEKFPKLGLDSLDEVSFAIKTMQEMAASPHAVAGPHRHNYYTVLWIQEGQGTHDIDFKTYNLKPHTLFFINPLQVHKFHAETEPKGMNLVFSEDFLFSNGISPDFIANLRLFADADEYPPLIIPAGSIKKIQSIIDTICGEVENDNILKDEAIGTHLKLLFIECHRIRNSELSESQQEGSVTHFLVKQFRELVDQNYRTLHKVSDYAQSMHITPNHLNEVIRQSIGTTAKEYILKRIFLEAKRLAFFTDLGLKDIALELGFNDPAYFSRSFKKYQGVNFAEFKAQLREN